MSSFFRALLAWYDDHRRSFPWRSALGEIPNPYHVWLSEIMLQQTTTATVQPYFIKFIHQWPTLEDFSKSSLDDILHAWQGLGYYARARHMHKCAQIMAESGIPHEETVLLKLPGIGPYTAAAIAAIAFNQPTIPVDGNIARIIARMLALEDPFPGAMKKIQSHAKTIEIYERPGDLAQALMDLGASICKPKNPICESCPIQSYCQAYKQKKVDCIPCKLPKPFKPIRYAVAFWGKRDKDGAVFLRRRPSSGLLGGMIEIPSTPWRVEGPWADCEIKPYAPEEGNWISLPGRIKHTFTHFHLCLDIVASKVMGQQEGIWCSPDHFERQALPTVMKKIIHHVLSFEQADVSARSCGDDVVSHHGGEAPFDVP